MIGTRCLKCRVLKMERGTPWMDDNTFDPHPRDWKLELSP